MGRQFQLGPQHHYVAQHVRAYSDLAEVQACHIVAGRLESRTADLSTSLSADQPTQEPAGSVVLRIGQNLLGRSRLDDSAAIEEAHRVGDVAAEAISWVAMTMVLPVAANSPTSASTSPTSSGFRALVISSSSNSFGS